MRALRVLFVLASVSALIAACSDDASSGGPVENTGSSCTAPAQCYPNLDGGTLKGAVQCLTKVSGGYCTHLCTTDADCCAVPGECTRSYKQVCAPFESTGLSMCFLSCEDADVKAEDATFATNTNGFCQTYANAAFGCRSTGGGAKNRKVCLP